ncbi:MAG TPA: hypothetical protein VKY70_00880 [Pseudomonas sp.]|nr:hypothetical protein [Pseudomonas sp.]
MNNQNPHASPIASVTSQASSSDFAKIFYANGIGQILVMRDTNDECNPALNIYFEPKGFGVCRIGLGFKDTDDGWEKRDEAFAKMDQAMAEEAVRKQLALIEDACEALE